MSFLRRLYRGDTNLDFVGYRKRWYLASAVIILICLLSIVFRGFNFGIEFAGGNQFLIEKPSGTLQQVRSAVEGRGIDVSSAQVVRGDNTRYVIRTPELTEAQRTDAIEAITGATGVDAADVSSSAVSSSWGKSVTNKALLGLVVFLLVVGAYIWIRFEQKMALAALGALVHDLVLTAGVYSLVGFEVTPGTVIGLLTILGFSLYDTVVVFDKVDENARGLLGSSRYTYPEAANLAVNQTLMRSINTSLIGLLPVAGLLFVGAGLLGVGTLKDLALVLFVGMLTGAYSSLFLATPWLVDLKLLDQRYKLHTQRVLAKRAAGGEARVARATRAGAAKAAPAKAAPAKAGPGAPTPAAATATEERPEPTAAPAAVDALASSAPRPGAKPPPRKRSGGNRSGGGKRR
jgi:preprotein translocase subunit SecF